MYELIDVVRNTALFRSIYLDALQLNTDHKHYEIDKDEKELIFENLF